MCFLSLVDALEGLPHRIRVVGDRLSDETLDFFSRFPVSLVNEELDNSRSMSRAIDFAMQSVDDEWVYFCEDDYLHVPFCFKYVDDLLESREEYLAYKPKPRWRRLRVDELEKKPLYLFLPDYPDKCRPKYRWPSFLFHSRYCHWRQVESTTGSFIGKADKLKKLEPVLRHFAERVDDGYLSRKLFARVSFWERGLCISPIPGLSSHMHEKTMSVFGDWAGLLGQLQKRLKAPEASRIARPGRPER